MRGVWRYFLVLYQKPDFHTSPIQGSDTTDRFSSTRSSESYYQLPPLHKVEQPDPSVLSRLGAGAGGLALFPSLIRGTGIFHPTPFGGPTAQIASPRRDLAIGAVEDENGKG